MVSEDIKKECVFKIVRFKVIPIEEGIKTEIIKEEKEVL